MHEYIYMCVYVYVRIYIYKIQKMCVYLIPCIIEKSYMADIKPSVPEEEMKKESLTYWPICMKTHTQVQTVLEGKIGASLALIA